MGRRGLPGSLGALLVVTSLLMGRALGEDAKPFRVCADPDNLPFSNHQGQGYENKIAELVARELGVALSYYWWPHQRGLVRNTLGADQCDVLIGIPKGYDPVLWTKPYYRSSYVIAYAKDRRLQITSLDAPPLRQLRIGVHRNTPPEEALARRGILDNVVGYSLFYDPRDPTSERPGKLVADLGGGAVDVAIAWGPLVGYFAKKLNAPLEVVPLAGDPGVPFAFDISMGVRKGNQALKTRLEDVLDRRQADIRRVLEDYGVPLVPDNGAQSQNTPKKLNPYTGNARAIQEGRTLYLQRGCSGCHGVQGGGGMAMPLLDDVWKFGSSDEVLFKVIKGEVAESTMPKVFGDLEPDQVWKIIAYIRSLYAGDPSRVDW